jgi:capsular polysaccharide biosynthesis protein
VKEAASVREIRIVSRAVPSLYPIKPLKWVYAGLSFAIAMVVAIGWILLFHSRNVDEPDAPAVGAIQAAHRNDNIG